MKEWLKSVGLFSLEKRRVRADVIIVETFLKRVNGGEGADLLFLVGSDKIQGIRMKLHQRKFRWDIRKAFFITERVVGHWNRLPSKVARAPRLLREKVLPEYSHTVQEVTHTT